MVAMRTLQQVVWKRRKADSDQQFRGKDRKSLKLKATTTTSHWISSLTSYCFIEPVQLQPWFKHLAGRLAISRPAALSGNTWWWSQNTVIPGSYELSQQIAITGVIVGQWWGGSLTESQRGRKMSHWVAMQDQNRIITSLLFRMEMGSSYISSWRQASHGFGPELRKKKKKKKNLIDFISNMIPMMWSVTIAPLCKMMWHLNLRS